MALSRWSKRSPEEAALLNPALFAAILFRATDAYHMELGAGLPLELAFLVAPVVLVKSTREALPRQVRTSLPAWLQENPNIRLRFADAASSMAQLTREGLLFGCSCGALTLAGAGIFTGKLDRKASAAVRSTTDEVQDILARASFVGKWYAAAGTAETVMALWGVRP